MKKALGFLVVLIGLLITGGSLLLPGMAHAMDVTLAWDANTEPDLAGYNIYWSEATGVPVANRTKVNFPLTMTGFNPAAPAVIIPGLPNDKRIYFVCTAYDNETPSLESGYSNQVYADTYTGKPPKSPILRLIQWILGWLFGGLRVA